MKLNTIFSLALLLNISHAYALPDYLICSDDHDGFEIRETIAPTLKQGILFSHDNLYPSVTFKCNEISPEENTSSSRLLLWTCTESAPVSMDGQLLVDIEIGITGQPFAAIKREQMYPLEPKVISYIKCRFTDL